jgi:hypothetical protein
MFIYLVLHIYLIALFWGNNNPLCVEGKYNGRERKVKM